MKEDDKIKLQKGDRVLYYVTGAKTRINVGEIVDINLKDKNYIIKPDIGTNITANSGLSAGFQEEVPSNRLVSKEARHSKRKLRI